jgi:hypothetical protein
MLLVLSATAKSIRLGLQPALMVFHRLHCMINFTGLQVILGASETTQKLTSEQEKCLVKWNKDLETQGKAPSLLWSER